jgi:class 3 adenylate cyclase
MDAELNSSIKFVSGALIEWSSLAQSARSLPAIEYDAGAVLCVDISGFTRIAGRLCRRGGAGVERLSEILTEYYTNLVAAVEERQGVVFGFEGDALMAGWRGNAGDLCFPLFKACHCATEMLGRCKDWNIDDQNPQMRISIGAGEIQLMHLGDATRRCYFLPGGAAVEEARALIVSADANEILISEENWSLVRDRCEGEAHKQGAIRLLRSKVDLVDDLGLRESHSISSIRDLSNYLPRALRARLSSLFPNWIGELRAVTIVFLKISSKENALSAAGLNTTLKKIERNVDSVDGEILEVALSKDGLELLCVFGLPSEAHENLGQRAVLATMRIHAEALEQGLNISAGIGTGQVFCGPIGPRHRRQYCVVGAPVNLASRIASVAAGRDGPYFSLCWAVRTHRDARFTRRCRRS